ncbi:MAG TPA: hypothetical protein QGF58_24720 [Myxococcota bacterium]|nr:hypothetical protein [Myxococcota bacterium]
MLVGLLLGTTWRTAEQILASDGVAHDQFGSSLVTAGDFDRDGFDDVLVGVDRVGDSDFTGAAYLLYGGAEGVPEGGCGSSGALVLVLFAGLRSRRSRRSERTTTSARR